MNEAQRLAATCTATNVDDDRHDDADRQYLFIIRHGDRWDYSYPEWKKLPTSRLGDSPLSPLGHQQARQVGEFLDEYLHARGLTHDIAWLSSPFLRCLQTSNEALNAMKIANAHYEGSAFREIPIFPEYSIFEWDGHQGEWHSDLPPLEERKHYFPRLDMEYEGFFTPELPGK
jgi:broad specificity phosphatase PhoE